MMARPRWIVSLVVLVTVPAAARAEGPGDLQLGGPSVTSWASVASPGASLLDRSVILDQPALVSGLQVTVPLLRPRPGSSVGLELAVATAHDLAGQNAASLGTRLSFAVGRVDVRLAERVDHTFVAGHDAVDLHLSVGLSTRVSRRLRLGVEWTGQDLEELFDDEADGGTRQHLEASATWLLGRRLALALGPMISLGVPVGALRSQVEPGGHVALEAAF
jgi:hypothetical protein